MNGRQKHIMIMAGGTGGHIFPGLAVAAVLQSRSAEVSWLGTPAGLENRLVPLAGIELDRIAISGLRGRGALGWLVAPWRIMRAMVQAWRILKRRRPGCVLSMGGYVAGPGALAARMMGIPLVVHEQNAIAGMTNRLLRPLARRIFTGFPDTLKQGEHVGNPVRAAISSLASPEERMAGRSGPLNILVIGGSQGAAVFGRIVPRALARLSAAQRPTVVHQAGRQVDATRQSYLAAGMVGEVCEFIDDMAGAWAEADIAICRAGALTVAELAAAGVAAILVPYPHAVDDHQRANARFLADESAAWLVDESEFTPDWLAGLLARIDRTELQSMAVRARAMARIDAADQVATACLEVAA